MSILKAALILGSALGVVAVANPAHATHKNWQLKNTGSQCFFTSYSTSEPPWGYLSISNYTSSARYAVCPVTLAGRWGSSAGGTFPVPLWAAAMSAKALIVNNNTNGSVFDCYVRTRLQTESIYFSSGATTTTTGAKALLVASNNQWGGTLEAAQSNQVRSMDFDCRIPGVPANGSASYIDAYQVKICQRDAACTDGGGPIHEGPPLDGIDFDSQFNYVQTNGYECTVSDFNEANNVSRGYSGITNNASYSFGVFCPITQPSDDSWYHSRRIAETRVHYASPNANTFRPSCYFAAMKLSGSLFPLDSYGSNEFVAGGTNDVVQPTATMNMGPDVSMGVWCNIQPGQSIKGVTARLSETHISGGQ